MTLCFSAKRSKVYQCTSHKTNRTSWSPFLKLNNWLLHSNCWWAFRLSGHHAGRNRWCEEMHNGMPETNSFTTTLCSLAISPQYRFRSLVCGFDNRETKQLHLEEHNFTAYAQQNRQSISRSGEGAKLVIGLVYNAGLEVYKRSIAIDKQTNA